MAEATIPVDIRNPGQVFACLGLMEASEHLSDPEKLRGDPVTGAYAWKDGTTRASFTLRAPGEDDPVRSVIAFLSRAEVRALNAPRRTGPGVAHETRKWDVRTEPFAQDPCVFPVSPPSSPAPLPMRLVDGGRSISISHWADDAAIGRDNVKFWAGAGGYPGAALARDAVLLLRDLGDNLLATAAADPFAFSAPQSSCFRFDWRQSYIPRDAGFSPNDQGSVTMAGYPLVELLAAIGLANARPERITKLAYRYAVSEARLPLALARPLLGGSDMGFSVRRFRMRLGWPGQEGQARCIIDSTEEHA